MMTDKKRLKSHHDSMDVLDKLALGPKKLSSYLEDNVKPKKSSCIYVHVPFCNKICTFCSLRRTLSSPSEDYHTHIIREIEEYSKLEYIQNTVFDAIYFGGGTPTTLSPYALREIVVAIKNHFTLTDDAEITIETTLSELSEEHLHWMKVEGVNRLSLGVQTFSDEGRKILGRKGDGEFAYQRVLDVIEKGFENVSIDLIYNYENQTIEDLKEDLSNIYDLNLSGFSLYSLINMGGQKKAQSQDLKMDRLFFDTISKKSLENGYEFLELTKLVKTDRYKYIINRHSGEDTLPLGAGAGGNLGNLMLMNPIGIDDYKTSIDNFKEKRGMAFHEHYNDYVQIKGDLQRGIIPSNKNLIQKNHKIKSFIDEKEKAGLLQSNGDKIIFSLDGIFWGNNIAKDFLSLLG